MRWRLLIVCVGVLALTAVPVAAADEPYDPDLEFLKESKVDTDGPGLLKYLAERSGHDDDLLRVDELIRQLGHSDFQMRRQAAEKLIAVGPPAHARLLEAQKDKDPERARGARQAAEAINRTWNFGLNLTVVRRLVKLALSSGKTAKGEEVHRDAGSPLSTRFGGRGDGGEGDVARALLQFLPYAADEECEEEIWFGLDSIAKAQPQIVAALADSSKDKLPVRRAVAGYLFTRRGNPDQRAAGKKLLTDPDPLVRLRTAQGLLGAKDKEAILVLIELLEKLRWTEEAWQAEEMLHYVAGDDSPETIIGSGSTEARQKCRKAWQDWWSSKKTKIDLGKLDLGFQRPGLILVATSQGEAAWNRTGHVRLIGCDGKFRWQLPVYAKHLQLLPGDRIMAVVSQFVGTKHADGRPRDLQYVGGIDDRSLNGEILWQGGAKYLPHVAYRLANGNTFVLGLHRAVEITPERTETRPALRELPNGWASDFAECRMLANGRIVALAGPPSANFSAIGEFDPAAGQLLKKTQVLEPLERGRIQPIGNGNFLLSEPGSGKVMEVDWSGKTVWRLNRPGFWPRRLRNGNTLFFMYTGLEQADRLGKIVWKAFLPRDSGGFFSPVLGLVGLGFDIPRPADPALWVNLCLKQLTSQDPVIRHGAAWSLGELGSGAEAAIPQLIATLDDSNAEVRSAASSALQKVGARALREILAASKDPKANIRASAINLLGDFQEQAEEVVPVLVAGFNDKEFEVRHNATRSLARLGPTVPGVVPAFVQALGSKYPDVRGHAADCLAGMAPAAKESLKPLWKWVQADKDIDLRRHAAETIGRIGKNDRAIALRFIEMVRSSNPDDQFVGASGLAEVGMAAKESIPALIQALMRARRLDDGQQRNRLVIALLSGLGKVGGAADEAVPEMITFLEERKEAIDVRKCAADALGNMGPKAKSAIDALTKASNDPDLNATCEAAIRRITR